MPQHDAIGNTSRREDFRRGPDTTPASEMRANGVISCGCAFPSGEDVHHGDAVRGERVGEQPTMALPPERLRAHHGGSRHARVAHQALEAGGKSVGVHVVGIPPERRVGPGGVDSSRAWPPQAAKAPENAGRRCRRAGAPPPARRAKMRVPLSEARSGRRRSDAPSCCCSSATNRVGGVRGVPYGEDSHSSSSG